MEDRKRNGFHLGELCAVLVILSVLAAVLYPVFAQRRGEHRNTSCISNIKQIEIGMLGYVLDNDDKFPFAAQPLAGERGLLSGWAVTHDTQGRAVLSPNARGKSEVEKQFTAGPLFPYIKNVPFFRCPSVPENFGPLSFMYNDLAAGASQDDFTAVARSIVLCDGEDFAGNVGHAYDPKQVALPATYSPEGAVVSGARLQAAPERHNGGAFYGYADGHVKWSQPRYIFFPPRLSKSRSHIDKPTGEPIGPDPTKLSGATFKGRNYNGTFHIR